MFPSHKCPNCGYVEEYRYRGVLKGELDTILKMLKEGIEEIKILAAILDTPTIQEYLEKTKTSGDSSTRIVSKICGDIKYIKRKYNINAGKKQLFTDKEYNAAYREHMWLLRAEGLIYRVIGNRVDKSVERVRQSILKFGRDSRRATRHAHFQVHSHQ